MARLFMKLCKNGKLIYDETCNCGLKDSYLFSEILYGGYAYNVTSIVYKRLYGDSLYYESPFLDLGGGRSGKVYIIYDFDIMSWIRYGLFVPEGYAYSFGNQPLEPIGNWNITNGFGNTIGSIS